MRYGGTNEAWIVGAVRTPIGRHGGALSTVRPDDLGAVVLEALVERTGVPPPPVFGLVHKVGPRSGAAEVLVFVFRVAMPAFYAVGAGLVERLAAQVTAFSDAVTMLESMPTPHSTRPSPVSASMKLTAWASEPAPVACW